MKKNLMRLCVTIAICFVFSTSYSQCITYYYFTATKNGNCNVDLEWKYQQCNDGKFYVQYSLNGTNFYTIAIINSTGGSGSDETYQYTDTHACPGTNPNDPVQYRILFVNDAGGQEFSIVRSVDMGDACSCSNNNTNRCSGIPTITISGSSTICTGTSQSYTLSNTSYGATWSITSGSGLVSITSSNPSIITISNSSSNGIIVLSANIKGCLVITKTIIVGTPNPIGINLEFQACIGGSDWEAGFATSPLIPSLTYLWSINGSSYSNLNPYYNERYSFAQSNDPSITLNFKIQNSCGTSAALDYPATFYSSCGYYRMSISPNPIKETANLIIEENNIFTKGLKKPFKVTINIYDKNNILVRSFTSFDKNIPLNKKGLGTGLYIVQAIIGTEKISKQILIE